MTYLILSFAILFLIMSLRRLDFALMLIIAFLPAYQIRFSVFGVPSTVLELMILISFSVWFVRHTKFLDFVYRKYSIKDYIRERKGRIGYPFGFELITAVFISYVAIAVAGFSDASLGIWKAYFFEPALFYIMALNVFGAKTSFGKAPKAFVNSFSNCIMAPLSISAFVVSLVAIYQKFTGAWILNEFWAEEATRRVTSVFSYPNALGLYLGMLIPLLVGWGFFLLKQKKNYFFVVAYISITVAVSVVAIIFAKSEGALIGVIVAICLIGLLANKWSRIVVTAICLIGAVVIFLTPSLKTFTIEKITLSDLSGEIRKQQWRETWEMLSDGKFLFGAGLANYQESILPYHREGIYFNFEKDPDFRRKIVIFDERYKADHWQPVEVYMYPHNVFLNFWSELGIPGMVLFVWIFIKFFVVAGEALRKFSVGETKYRGYDFIILGAVGAISVTIIHGMVDVPYFKNDLAVLFWLVIVVVSVARLNIVYETKK